MIPARARNSGRRFLTTIWNFEAHGLRSRLFVENSRFGVLRDEHSGQNQSIVGGELARGMFPVAKQRDRQSCYNRIMDHSYNRDINVGCQAGRL